jgi:hypothetical protein
MWLILCSASDIPALWAAEALSSHNSRVEVVTQEELGLALRWEHWVTSDDAGFRVELADGREIDSREVDATLNRVTAAATAHLEQAEPVDREYGLQEFSALFLSVLESLPDPVLNRPTAQGLSGAWRHASEWTWLASQAGLRTLPYTMTPDPDGSDLQPMGAGLRPAAPVRTAFVVGGEVVGIEDGGLHEGCLSLARSVGAGLLGVDFLLDEQGSALFVAATPSPNLTLGGDPLIAAIARAFAEGAEPA